MRKLNRWCSSVILLALITSNLAPIASARAAELKAPAFFDSKNLIQESAPSPFASDEERLYIEKLRQYGVETKNPELLEKIELAKNNAKNKINQNKQFKETLQKRKQNISGQKDTEADLLSKQKQLFDQFNDSRFTPEQKKLEMKNFFQERNQSVDAVKRQQSELDDLKAINDKLQQDLNTELDVVLTPEERAEVGDVEADYLYSLEDFEFPNDSEINNQWEIGSILSQFPSHFETEASTTERVVVAIIDSGIDYMHEDLVGHFYNPATCFDEMGTTTPDGCPFGGWDYVDDDNDPRSESVSETHGTEIAGLIAAQTDSNLGIASLSNNLVNIMPIRVTDDNYIELSNIIDAIYFAVENGADVINMSFSGPTYSSTLEDAIEYAETNDVIVVTAAGNYGNNIDNTPSYPASYDFDNVIAVGALNSDNTMASFSNYGDDTVDFAAPGTNLVTTNIDGGYTIVNGTSFSAAIASAMAGALIAHGEDPLIVFANLDESPTLAQRTIDGRVLGAAVDLPPTEPLPLPQFNATATDPIYGDYYIYAKGGMSVASGTYELSLNNLNSYLGVPSTYTPGNTSSYQLRYGDTHLFGWNPVSGAAWYGVYVRDMTTGELIVDRDAATVGVTLSINDIFVPGHSYRWNMRAYDSNGDYSAFSGLRYFEIATAPTTPDVYGPGATTAPGGSYVDSSQLLSWYNVSADYYEVSLRDRDTNILILDEYVVDNGTTYQTPSLAAGHSYKWDVRACYDNGGCSSYSNDRYFRIGSTNTAPNSPTSYGSVSAIKNVAYSLGVVQNWEADNDSIRFNIDWGDGQSDTTSYVSVGTVINELHTYTSTGTFCIKARSYDSEDYSPWSGCKYVVVSTAVTGADLVGEIETTDDSLLASQTTTIDYTILNIGGTTVTDDFTVDFYLSTDQNISAADDMYIGTDNVTSNISASSEISDTASVTMPPAGYSGYYGDGRYYVGIIVDAHEDVTEVSESNNASRSLGVDTKPVQVSGTQSGVLSFTVSFSGTATSGEPFALTITPNQGGYSGQVSLEALFGTISPNKVHLDGSDTISVTLNSNPGINWIMVSDSENGGSGTTDSFYLNGSAIDYGNVKVTVVDGTGNPLAGATVKLLCSSTGSTCSNSSVYEQDSPSNGAVTFSGVTAGRYIVSVTYEDHTDTSHILDVGSGFTLLNQNISVSLPVNADLTPIILVPGIIGSTESESAVIPVIRSSESELRLADSFGDLGILNGVGWGAMIDAYHNEYGFEEGSSIIACPWNWKQSARIAAIKLKECIDKAKALTGKTQVDIIAHSMGGLVARAYIQSDDLYDSDVRKVAFIGTPHLGGSEAYELYGGHIPDASTRAVLFRALANMGPDDIFFGVLGDAGVHITSLIEGSTALALTTNETVVGNYVRWFVPTVEELLPTYPVLQYQDSDSGLHKLSYHKNVFLNALNNDSCPSSCGGLSYNSPSSRFGTGKVEAKMFYNSRVETPHEIVVDPTDRTTSYPDGRWINTIRNDNSGDGTVYNDSATYFVDIGIDTDPVNLSSDSIKHSKLPYAFISQVGEYITGQAFQTSAIELEAMIDEEPKLTIELEGAHQPLVTAPNGKSVGIESNSDTVNELSNAKNVDINTKFSSFAFNSPLAGTYTITLYGQTSTDLPIYVDYQNDEKYEVVMQQMMHDGATTTISFTLLPNSSTSIDFGDFVEIPLNLTATQVSGNTTLNWSEPENGSPTSYNIYTRMADDPVMQYVTQVSTTTYTTSDVWAGASTTLMKRYQVSAVYSSGEESFLSNVAYNNDEDQDGLPDHLEIIEATSTSTPDTDSDGLTDGEEYFNYGTDPTLYDTDGDGISDYDEVTPGGTGTTTPSVSAAQIYLDSFENGWAEFGTYNAVTDTQNTAEIAQGTKAIGVSTNSTWSGIGMRNLNGLNTAGYNTIKFAYHPGNVTNHITRLKFFDADYQPVFSDYLTISDYITEDISGGLQSKWYNIEIPLEDLGIADTTVYNLLFITSNTATFYLDNLHLSNGTQGSEYDTVVFDDELQNGWDDQSSWSTTADFSSTETTYASSSMAIELQFNTTWAGLGLITPNPVQGSQFTNLHVAYNPGATGGQTDKIILSNENYETLTPDYISFSDYISGTPQTNTWYSLSIPLVDLGASTSTIKEMIVIGSASTTIYLDDIRFTDPVAPSDITTSDIYVDGFTSPWDGEYGEWDSVADYYSASAAYTGSFGIEMEYQNEWAGNTLYSSSTFDVGDFSGFHIAYNPGSTTDQEILIQMEDDTHTQYSDFVSFDNYISGSQQADTWYELNIPLSDLGVSADDLITDITLITSGTSTVYYDDIYFTATSSQSSTTTQTSTNVSIYTDALLPPWSDGGGWLSTTTYNSATHTTGSYGMQTQFTNGSWSETVLEASTPIDTTSLNSLRFAFNLGANASDTVYIKTKDETDTEHSSSVSLDNYISNIAANTWYNLIIPLTDLGIAAGELVKKILFISQDGPTVYFDNMYFGEPNTGGANSFDEGMVTLSFDDGWLSQYTEAFPVLNSASIKGSFNIISEPTINADDVTELVANPSLESDTGGVPDGWQFGTWGTNDATTTYPVSGTEGSDAARVEMTSYTDGDAKWYFNDVAIYENNDYTVSYQYRSDVSNDFVIRYTMQDTSNQYDTIKTNPSSTSWASTSVTITAPEDVASITVFPLLTAVGYLEVDDFSVHQNPVYMNPAHVLAIEAAGHEIGSHTQTHQALTTISAGEQDDEIAGSRTDLLSTIGVSNIDILAYPYGDYNTTVQNLVASSGYTTARSSDLGYNLTNTNKYALKIQSAERDTTLSEMESWIQTAKEDKSWLIILFHQFDDIDSHPYATSPDLFEDLVDYIDTDGITTVTVGEGVELME